MKRTLSEIFLDELHEDYSDDSVGKALQICDAILKKQLEGIQNEEEFVAYFFEQVDEETVRINERGEDLFAFWDVFDEFHEVIGRLPFASELTILTTIMEVDYINKSVENMEIEKMLSDKEATVIKEVGNYICELKNLISITTYTLWNDGAYSEKEISTKFPHQEVGLDPYERIFIDNIILKHIGKATMLEVCYYTDKEVKVKIIYDKTRWEIASEQFKIEL